MAGSLHLSPILPSFNQAAYILKGLYYPWPFVLLKGGWLATPTLFPVPQLVRARLRDPTMRQPYAKTKRFPLQTPS